MLFVGCAHSPKEAAATLNPTAPMTETRAVEIAVAAAKERGWKGPFDAFATRSNERGDSQWGSVRLLDHDKENRLLIVYLSTKGEVLDFSVRPR
jgi:hypothetical protein